MKHLRTNLSVKPSGSLLGASLEHGAVVWNADVCGTAGMGAATDAGIETVETGSWGEPLKKANSFGTLSWLPDMDLNHDKQIQSLLCYRYTIGQSIGRSR